MTNPLARTAPAARGVVIDMFRGAQAGAEYVLDLFGPLGTASLAVLALILIRW